ncbi:MAG: hypothetical protein ACRDRH_17095 [Pseudonocardia sp.]
MMMEDTATLTPSADPGADASRQTGPQGINVQLAAGTSAQAIQSTVDAYRQDLGNNRQEINWDGVPDNRAAPNLLPTDFFNTVVPRGVVFSTRGTGFQVSANAGVAPIEFDNINPTYSRLFRTFSPQRLFTPLGSNIMEVRFFVPGTSTPATTNGFGAVFTDVDRPGTRIEYLDGQGNRLARLDVPASPGRETLSFLGVRFLARRVARVRITSGNTVLGPDERGDRDLVVMDDFIFGTPTAV